MAEHKSLNENQSEHLIHSSVRKPKGKIEKSFKLMEMLMLNATRIHADKTEKVADKRFSDIGSFLEDSEDDDDYEEEEEDISSDGEEFAVVEGLSLIKVWMSQMTRAPTEKKSN